MDRLRKRQQLPPLEQVPDLPVSGSKPAASEYKRWLPDFRRHSVALTPVKPMKQLRCQTATLRIKKRYRKSGRETPVEGERQRIFTVSGGDCSRAQLLQSNGNNNCNTSDGVFYTKTQQEEPAGTFDLKALNDALTKPRNKVVPMQVMPCHRSRSVDPAAQ